DRDVHHFGFSTIASPQTAATLFSVTLSALDISGETITVHQGPVALTGAGDHGPVTMTPTNAWVADGTWSGSAAVNTPDTNVRLTADDGQGQADPSAPFDVQIGALDHFAWDSIASPQRVD
ncbi:hypothetical protein JZU48_02990, partial [bacterium]|nr:hypothetical protein [bacterium]